ncbi:MAG: hypothetical protein H7245_18040 [Candidatus Saccharibacteria bacterium]|nr:hypothetical protein [Pseudorhodobacter sp.]
MGEITGNGTAVRGLGGAAGYGETALPRGDDTVTRVDVSAVFGVGFSVGGVHYDADQLYVSTDGLVSFGKGLAGVVPPAAPYFAIFNADVDTRLDGEGAESGAVWLDVDTAQDCVTITWDQVGFYRRNATLTDTFQMQFFDRGNGRFDVVYRYHDIAWTSGDLQGGFGGLDGVAALIGYRLSGDGAPVLLAASGDAAAQLALDTTAGNTGVRGLWVLPFGSTPAITGTPGADSMYGTAAGETMQGLGGDDVLYGSAGADSLDGGTGQDRADYSNATGAVVVDLRDLAANQGLAAGDSYVGIEWFVGSGLADTLRGSPQGDGFDGGRGMDVLAGFGGSDTMAGGDQNDALYGGAAKDLLSGGLGNDRLVGGTGVDTMTGGTGADQFVYRGTGASGADWITDYDAAQGDVLAFARAGATRGDFRVTYVTDAGGGAAGVKEAHVTYLPTGKLIWVLVDGAAEDRIVVQSSMNSFDLL